MGPVAAATVELAENVLVGLMSSATDFSGRNDVAAAVFTDVTVQRAVDRQPDAEAATLAIETVYPNPARDALTVRIGLARAGAYTLDVMDALGRRVATHAGTALSPTPDPVALDLAGVGPGVYLLRLRDGSDARATQRITVVR